MKRVISVIIILSLLTLVVGCEKENVINREIDLNQEITVSNKEFAFDILRVIAEEEDNHIFISPISIAIALTMTYEGANGLTKQEIAEVLRLDGDYQSEIGEYYQDLLNYLNSYEDQVVINLENSLWIKEGDFIEEDFLKKMQELYQAYIEYLDFSSEDAAASINKWIETATNGKIKDMINPPIPENVILYLINAIYFNADWKYEFDSDNTYEADFYSEDGSIKRVDMMKDSREIKYYQGDSEQAITLPYMDDNLGMVIILPDQTNHMSQYITELNREKFDYIIDGFVDVEDMEIQIPKFKIEYGTKVLNDSLTKLGMKDAFSPEADFRNIREGIFISGVMHKSFIEVDEKGSEAAAATIVEMEESAMELDSFIANRPFIFVIYDYNADSILFLGKHS